MLLSVAEEALTCAMPYDIENLHHDGFAEFYFTDTKQLCCEDGETPVLVINRDDVSNWDEFYAHYWAMPWTFNRTRTISHRRWATLGDDAPLGEVDIGFGLIAKDLPAEALLELAEDITGRKISDSFLLPITPHLATLLLIMKDCGEIE